MNWDELKARLLAAGYVRLTGEPAGPFVERSTAGPGAGGPGSVFFSMEGRRVRLAIDDAGPITLEHLGEGRARLNTTWGVFEGSIEQPGLHCPGQAYITVSEGCIFSCRYCRVPGQPVHVKTADEVAALVTEVLDRISSISITSGVVGSVAEDEGRVLSVVKRLTAFGLPIGVSIYPREGTPERLAVFGVVEVKFNVETATGELFALHCPGLDRDDLCRALERSVALFGRNRVFSNVILGLGETDAEMVHCLERLCSMGVIPVVRPLSPAPGVPELRRPTAERIVWIAHEHRRLLQEAGLDPSLAVTMCSACTGCDLVPGVDL